jgi:hypothetical protein
MQSITSRKLWFASLPWFPLVIPMGQEHVKERIISIPAFLAGWRVRGSTLPPDWALISSVAAPDMSVRSFPSAVPYLIAGQFQYDIRAA